MTPGMNPRTTESWLACSSPWTSHLNEHKFWQEIFWLKTGNWQEITCSYALVTVPTCVFTMCARASRGFGKKGPWKMNGCKSAIDCILKYLCKTFTNIIFLASFTFHDFHFSTSNHMPQKPPFPPLDLFSVVPGPPRLLDQHGVANEELPYSRHVTHLAIIQLQR